MTAEGGEGVRHEPVKNLAPSEGGGAPHEPPARPLPHLTAAHADAKPAIAKMQHELDILPVPESNINLSDVDAESLAEKADQEQLRILTEWSLHDMPLEVKLWLAEEHQIYTTIEPREPGSFREFLKQRETERQLKKLRENTIKALKQYPAFRHEIHIGRKLKDVFGAVTDVKVEGVSYELDDPQKKYDKPPLTGTAKADKITYTVATKEAADLLHYTFQALLKTNSEQQHPVLIPEEKNGQYIVTVCNMTEYTNRIIGNALDQIVAKDDFDETKTVLPKEKKPVAFWKIDGETFHPDVEARLEEEDKRYQTLGKDIKKYPFLLGSDASAVFAVVRDAFRPIIHKYRGGDHLNQEQNPDKEKRLWIENDVNLIRPPAKSQKDVEEGPKAAQALSRGQHLRTHARRTLREAMQEKGRAIGTGIIKSISGGAESIMELGLLGAIAIPRVAAKLDTDVETWDKEKDKAEASRRKVAEILINDLLAEPVK